VAKHEGPDRVDVEQRGQMRYDVHEEKEREREGKRWMEGQCVTGLRWRCGFPSNSTSWQDWARVHANERIQHVHCETTLAETLISQNQRDEWSSLIALSSMN